VKRSEAERRPERVVMLYEPTIWRFARYLVERRWPAVTGFGVRVAVERGWCLRPPGAKFTIVRGIERPTP
jgi:hypothetical protein